MQEAKQNTSDEASEAKKQRTDISKNAEGYKSKLTDQASMQRQGVRRSLKKT
jgi:hypothetical protein